MSEMPGNKRKRKRKSEEDGGEATGSPSAKRRKRKSPTEDSDPMPLFRSARVEKEADDNDGSRGHRCHRRRVKEEKKEDGKKELQPKQLSKRARVTEEEEEKRAPKKRTSVKTAAMEELKNRVEEDERREVCKQDTHDEQYKVLEEWKEVMITKSSETTTGSEGGGGAKGGRRSNSGPGSAKLKTLLAEASSAKRRGIRRKVNRELENETMDRKMHKEDFLKLTQQNVDDIQRTMELLAMDRAEIDEMMRGVAEEGSQCLQLRLVTWLRPKAQTPQNGLVMLRQYNDLARSLKECRKDLKRMDSRVKRLEELTAIHCHQTQYVERCFWIKNQDINSLIPRQTRQEPMYQETGEPLIEYPIQPYKKERAAAAKAAAGGGGKGKRR